MLSILCHFKEFFSISESEKYSLIITSKTFVAIEAP